MCQRLEKVKSSTPSLAEVPVYGIIKEAETSETETRLGTREFNEKYFQSNPIFIDEHRTFYKFLGDRRLSVSWSYLLNPFKLFGAFRDINQRLKDKNVAGNLAGEGLVQGGILIIGPGDDANILYQYAEETGNEIPLEDFEEGLRRLEECNARVQKHNAAAEQAE